MPSPSETLAYYRAALRALRFLEQRRPTGRRFGTEADARWSALRGDLATADRIDLVIRDANAEWPGALGARAVFRMNDVAEDDPFGARWTPLDPVDGEEMWRAVLAEAPPTTLGAALDAVAAAWEVKLMPFSVGTIGPADRLLVAGPSAIASVIAAFAESSDLDWRRQVVVVATAPAERQLAALAPAFLNIHEPAIVIAADEPADNIGERRVLVSDDASADDRQWAEALAQKG